MRIQHNIAALNSYRQLNTNNNAISKNLEKLSSGYKINRAGDDAAGLAISEKMRAQITGLETAQKNANDGISLVQTAEGALTEVHSMLNRMVELATQSANGTYDTRDRQQLQKEIDALNDEIDRISQGTNFNGINLLDGNLTGDPTEITNPTSATIEETTKGAAGAAAVYTLDLAGMAATTAGSIDFEIGGNTYTVDVEAGATDEDIAAALRSKIGTTFANDGAAGDFTVGGTGTEITFTAANQAVDDSAFAGGASSATVTAGPSALGGLQLQIGDTGDDFNKIGVSVGKMDAATLGIGDIDISTAEGANDAIDKIKAAINTVSSTRGDLGAIQNRLEHTINNLGVTTENMTSAESRIRDTDMAEEMMAYTKNNILIQASQAMLAQANMLPQGVLQLLQ